MTFLRRGKDTVEEFRRSREAFGRPAEYATEPAPSLTPQSSAPFPTEAADHEPALPSPAEDAQRDMLEALRRNASAVAKDTSFSGTLKSDGNLYIEGHFEGQLEARDTIFIAESAEVKADLGATNVIVAGLLDGKVDASARFHAMPSARVAGDIRSAVLVVDRGSHINCRFAMKSARQEGRA